MMKTLFLLILLIFLEKSAHSQSLLNSYKKYRLEKAESIPNSKTRKKIKSYIKSHIIELDTVFQSYRSKTNFDFNNADTIFLIYQAPAESPFTSDVIIWSTKDSISYRQSSETLGPNKYKRNITYIPIKLDAKKLSGYVAITERDSLISLVSKRDYEIINHLGDNQKIDDGSNVIIYVAYRNNETYIIESCSPPKFLIETTYKKEL